MASLKSWRAFNGAKPENRPLQIAVNNHNNTKLLQFKQNPLVLLLNQNLLAPNDVPVTQAANLLFFIIFVCYIAVKWRHAAAKWPTKRRQKLITTLDLFVFCVYDIRGVKCQQQAPNSLYLIGPISHSKHQTKLTLQTNNLILECVLFLHLLLLSHLVSICKFEISYLADCIRAIRLNRETKETTTTFLAVTYEFGSINCCTMQTNKTKM